MVKKKTITTTTTTTTITEEHTSKHHIVHALIDRSGSMSGSEKSTVNAFNELLSALKDEQKKKKIQITLSLAWFNSGYDQMMSYTVVREAAPVDDVKPLTLSEYDPMGGTPLNDAIYRSITMLDKESKDDTTIQFMIITDGEENSSKEFGGYFGSQKIRQILEDRRTKQNWLIQYAGADHDALKSATVYGINVNHTMDFSKSKLSAAFRGLAASGTRYAASGSLASANFTETERKNSKDE